MCGLILGLSILKFHWWVCLFLGQYHVVLITLALQYGLKLGSMIPPALFFFLKTVLAAWDLLTFHTNFRIICSSSVKYIIRILKRCIQSVDVGSRNILTTLTFPTHEHKNIFPFICVFNSFHQCLYSFQSTSLLPPWLNLFLGILCYS